MEVVLQLGSQAGGASTGTKWDLPADSSVAIVWPRLFCSQGPRAPHRPEGQAGRELQHRLVPAQVTSHGDH